LNNKTVYLTIDDGPTDTTEHFLDVMKKHHSHAAIFVVGEMIKVRENIIRRIAAEGHSIGVHAYLHEYDIVYQSTKAFWEDNLKTRDMIEKITGKAPKIVCFPGGSSNTVSSRYCHKIMTDLAEVVYSIIRPEIPFPIVCGIRPSSA
jgi:peptidoglycan/xylan/chitin deacetylase (PgdA/CDA1 family)